MTSNDQARSEEDEREHLRILAALREANDALNRARQLHLKRARESNSQPGDFREAEDGQRPSSK